MENQASISRLTSPQRRGQRGAVIVIVLGLLVVLALIGVSFQYLVMNEYNAAKNWQTRYRARSMAQDGFSVAVARLRVEPTVAHWEGEGEWAYMTRRDLGTGNEKYARILPQSDTTSAKAPTSGSNLEQVDEEFWAGYFRNSKLGVHDENVRVSYSVASPRGTNDKGGANDNWVDLNGNGTIDGDESNYGKFLVKDPNKPLRGISYFRGDGIDGSARPAAVKSGTVTELGDRARLKIIDTNSQFNINDYKGAQLVYMLEVLGSEIEGMLKLAEGLNQDDQKNPFPREVAMDIVFRKDIKATPRIDSKEELRTWMIQLYKARNLRFNDKIFEFAMDFISTTSWPRSGNGELNTIRYDINRNPYLERPPANSPEADEWTPWGGDDAGALDTISARKSYDLVHGQFDGSATTSALSIDGIPGMLPGGARISRSPININTVSIAVLTTMIAGIEAEGRFILLPRKGEAESIFLADNFTTFNATTRIQVDLGRQPIFSGEDEDRLETQAKHHVFEVETDKVEYGNLAPYQAVPVGPFGYTSKSNPELKPDWKNRKVIANLQPDGRNPSASGNQARTLAAAILAERDQNGPFMSWMDFDYRVCHKLLLGFGGSSDGAATGNDKFPDLVNINRQNAEMPAGNSDGATGILGDLLPDPDELIAKHPAYRKSGTSPNYSYTKSTFKAWYHRAAVDMLRANFNPDGYYNKKNPESAMYTTVDVTDMRCQTAPLCFSTKGIYEVVSQGEIAGIRPNPRTGTLQGYALSQRTYRGVVETYRTLKHTTQKDFLKSRLTEENKEVTSHTLKGTMSYPNSIDLSSFDYEEDVDLKNALRRWTPEYQSGDAAGGASDPDAQERKRNLDGYYLPSAADEIRGYIGLYPLNRTPVAETQMTVSQDGALQKDVLNFWAPFTTCLESRPREDGNRTVIADVTPAGPDSGRDPNSGAGKGSNENLDSIAREQLNTGRGNIHPFGHVPVSRSGKGIIMAQWDKSLDTAKQTERIRGLWASTSSATPDPIARNYFKSSTENRFEDSWGGAEEFAGRSSDFAASYANLRPDGVLLRGWDLNPAFWPSTQEVFDSPYNLPRIVLTGGASATTTGTADVRTGGFTMSRLALLRYRCGGVSDSTPFSPIAGLTPQPDQVKYASPYDPMAVEGKKSLAQRLYGEEANWGNAPARGLDDHNKLYEQVRQYDTNFPYYQGWVDFWIKWELPPQGGTQTDTGDGGDGPVGAMLASAGEIDPGSANFSGLLGATQFGRFSEDLTTADGQGMDYLSNVEQGAGMAGDTFLSDLDFEGSSFFLFKESGGTLRVSQSYFSWAYLSIPPTEMTGSWKSSMLSRNPTRREIRIGNDYRVLGKPTNIGSAETEITGEVAFTNDIDSGQGDLGFAWARTETEFNLSQLLTQEQPMVLAPHNWYRFTLNYRSNQKTGDAHTIYIDGRKIPGRRMLKAAWTDSSSEAGSGMNTGESYRGGVPVPFDTENFEVTYYVQRSAAASIEVDPEDRLTIGCIYRRQRGEALVSKLENPGSQKIAPVFYLGQNLVAPANATIDDVRISASEPGTLPDSLYSSAAFSANSRYSRVTEPRQDSGTDGAGGNSLDELGRYENGFTVEQPQTSDFVTHYTMPVQVGSISWTEFRPWWDSFNSRRVDLQADKWSKAPQIALTVKAYDSLKQAEGERGRVMTLPSDQRMDAVERSKKNYWLSGGYALREGPDPMLLDSGKIAAQATDSEAGSENAFLKYQAHFIVNRDGGPEVDFFVLNATPILNSVSITVLTPPRILTFKEIGN